MRQGLYQPLMEHGGKPINVDQKVLSFAKEVVKKVKREKERRDREDLPKWSVWEKQYDGRLDLPEVIRADANLDIPLTREFVRQLVARLVNPVFQFDPVFVAKPRVPGLEEDAKTAERLLDYAFDQTELYDAASEFARQAMVYPFGVVKLRFVPERIERVRRVTEDGVKILEVKVSDAKPSVEPVPPIHFFIAPGAGDVDSAPWCAHRVMIPQDQLFAAMKRGEFVDVSGKLKSGGKTGDPPLFAIEVDDGDTELSDDDSRWYEIYEVYFTYWDEDGYPAEYLMLFEGETEEILRLTDNPFNDFPRPFALFTYEEVAGSVYGRPAARILEPIHRAYAASVNLRLVAAAKANNKLVFLPKGSGLKTVFANGLVRPGVYELDIPIGGSVRDVVSEFSLSQPFSHLPELENLLQSHAQRVLGLTDYNFGIEQVQRPTATGQVQLIEEGKQPLFAMLERFRKSLARLAEIALTRYMQYFPMGLELYMRTTGDQFEPLKISQWPAGIVGRQVAFETKVSSQLLNKELRKRDKLALADKLPTVYGFMMQLAQTAMQPGPLALAAARLLHGYEAAVREWMDDFEIDAEGVVPDLVTDAAAVQSFQQYLLQMQQAMAQQAASPAPPAPGGLQGIGGGPGMAAPGEPNEVPAGMAVPPAGPPIG